METIFYHYLDSDVSLDQSVTKFLAIQKKVKDVDFVVLAGEDYFLNETSIDDVEKLLDKFKERGINPKKVKFAVHGEERKFDKQQWEKMQEVDKFLHREGVAFGFEDMDKIWSVEEVENANEKIVKMANVIKKHDLSPYEKILITYLETSSRKYKMEKEDEHYSKSRSVFGVLNSNDIVCVGYAELMKAILEQVGDENIKVYSNHVACSSDGKMIDAYHCNLIIQVKDDKYGIDGFYYFDPTWDCGHEYEKTPSLAYFMVPLADIKKIKHQIRNDGALPAKQWKSFMKKTKRPRGSKLINSLNKRKEEYVKFTGDSLLMSKAFLKNCLKKNPELIDIIRDDLIENAYLEAIEKCDNIKKSEKFLRKILKTTVKSGIEEIPEAYRNDFLSVVRDCISENSIEKLEEWIDETKKIQETPYDTKTLINEFCKDKIEQKNKELNEQSYKEYIESQKSLLKSLGIEEDSLPEMSYEEYIKTMKEYISTWQNFTENKEEQILVLDKKMKELLGQNPEYKKLLDVDQDVKNEISSLMIEIIESNNLEGSLENEDRKASFEEIVFVLDHNINPNEKALQVIEYLNSEIQSCQQEELLNITRAEELEILPEETCIDTFIKKQKTRDKEERVEKWFKENSKPVGFVKTAEALKVVLSKMNRGWSEQDLYDVTSEIFGKSLSIASRSYDHSASNTFIQQVVQMEEDHKFNK